MTRRDGRLVVVLVLALYFGAVALSRHEGGDLWRAFGVPTLHPTFLDMHTIARGWDCVARHVSVTTPHNACFGRVLNYPRLITRGHDIGLGAGDTMGLAVLSGVLLLAVLLALLGPLSSREGLVVAAACCSPPVMLGIERGNPDVAIIGCLGAVGLLATRWRLSAPPLLLFLAALKFYPALGFAVLLRDRPRRAAVVFGLTSLIFAVYVALTFSDVGLVNTGSIRTVMVSYGELVVQQGLATGAGFAPAVPGVANIPHIIFLVPAALLLTFAAEALAPRCRAVADAPDAAVNGLWLGGAVFIGCWFLGSNFDYRLTALLLTLPALLHSARQGGGGGTTARITPAIMIAALWTSTTAYLGLHPPSAFPIDELLNIALMVILGASMLASGPDWLSRRRALVRSGAQA